LLLRKQRMGRVSNSLKKGKTVVRHKLRKTRTRAKEEEIRTVPKKEKQGNPPQKNTKHQKKKKTQTRLGNTVLRKESHLGGSTKKNGV